METSLLRVSTRAWGIHCRPLSSRVLSRVAIPEELASFKRRSERKDSVNEDILLDRALHRQRVEAAPTCDSCTQSLRPLCLHCP